MSQCRKGVTSRRDTPWRVTGAACVAAFDLDRPDPGVRAVGLPCMPKGAQMLGRRFGRLFAPAHSKWLRCGKGRTSSGRGRMVCAGYGSTLPSSEAAC